MCSYIRLEASKTASPVRWHASTLSIIFGWRSSAGSRALEVLACLFLFLLLLLITAFSPFFLLLSYHSLLFCSIFFSSGSFFFPPASPLARPGVGSFFPPALCVTRYLVSDLLEVAVIFPYFISSALARSACCNSGASGCLLHLCLHYSWSVANLALVSILDKCNNTAIRRHP